MILPILYEYEIAGDFSWNSRLKTAVYCHIRNYIIIGFIGIIFIIFGLFKGILSIANLPDVLMVSSNCWGLFLIILFLGHGLISVPRRIWDKGSLVKSLNFLYIKATILEEEINSTAETLDKIVKDIYMASNNLPINSNLQENIENLLSLCPRNLIEYHQDTINLDKVRLKVPTSQSLVKFHADIKQAIVDYKRTKFEWNELVKQCIYLEDIIESANSPFKRIVFTVRKERVMCFRNTREAIEWYWLVSLKPLLYKFVSMVLSLGSVLVILGEATLFIDIPVGVFPMLFKEDHGELVSQLLCLIPLCYILVCTYYGLFNLKLPGWYGLYPKNTDSSSLVYSAYYLSRLSAPLANNFFLFIKVSASVFSKAMGTVDLVAEMGDNFALFFPLLLVFFCFLNYINLYGRILNFLGVSHLNFIDESQQHKVAEGKNMIKREKLILQRKSSNEIDSDWEMINIDLLRDCTCASYNSKV
jgi:LMBR1-like membrane protein